MDDDFLRTVEENFVYCLHCEDSGWINTVKPRPCSYCNLTEYKEWEREQKAEKLRAMMKKRK